MENGIMNSFRSDVRSRNTNKEKFEQIESEQLAVERYMLGISLRNKILNQEMRRITGDNDSDAVIRKWNCADHVACNID